MPPSICRFKKYEWWYFLRLRAAVSRLLLVKMLLFKEPSRVRVLVNEANNCKSVCRIMTEMNNGGNLLA